MIILPISAESSDFRHRMDTIWTPGEEGAVPPLPGMIRGGRMNYVRANVTTEVPDNITQISKSMTIIGHSTTHTPREGVAGLIDLVHAAIVERHAPRVSGVLRDRSSRPVLGRHHIGERMAVGQGNASDD